MILVVILLAVSLFIIANTIKLATFNRREEIAIMKMCGATNAFVRWPFVFEGLILGWWVRWRPSSSSGASMCWWAAPSAARTPSP